MTANTQGAPLPFLNTGALLGPLESFAIHITKKQW